MPVSPRSSALHTCTRWRLPEAECRRREPAAAAGELEICAWGQYRWNGHHVRGFSCGGREDLRRVVQRREGGDRAITKRAAHSRAARVYSHTTVVHGEIREATRRTQPKGCRGLQCLCRERISILDI